MPLTRPNHIFASAEVPTWVCLSGALFGVVSKEAKQKPGPCLGPNPYFEPYPSRANKESTYSGHQGRTCSTFRWTQPPHGPPTSIPRTHKKETGKEPLLASCYVKNA